MPYAMSTLDDWSRRLRRSRTSTAVSSPHRADVRDYEALKSALDAGVAELGHLDIVLADDAVCHTGVSRSWTSRLGRT